ncbi:imidazolonepropionase [Desulfosarcina sp.]|uniref:imidazolonepropionase n=1 Tax=Desulfosarcina sp. TaxID=2027861 RepID=UPI0029A45914|nr:imidazolonepropionase [Desulfosarcina sp.]MDX2453818.1 imidazolonepropionase [Desulfosarcina sp.]MDX2491518.1 imidazolonepropionase [Desulfosarcina sp.]
MNAKLSADLYITGAAEIITCVANGTDRLGRIPDAVLAAKDGWVLAVGPANRVEAEVDMTGAKVIDASRKIVAPGFVDCHTHLIFGKSRAKEFALKMTRSTVEIEAMGIDTGIPASIAMTREASEDDLFHGAMDRLTRMLRHGTTTVESKSGYGINRTDELKMLRVNQRLSAAQSIDIVSTFLGAHDFPPEIDRNRQSERNRYIETLIHEMIPEVAESGLAEFCDIYCDDGYYTAEESRRILEAGIRHELRAKIHTDAYSGIGGSALAAELGAISADHLNYTSPLEMIAMAKAGVVGVVLPALDFAVAHHRPVVPRKMIEAGMTLALGTNLNPGNWTESMRFVMLLACRNHGMSLEEALLAATMGAAKAIGRDADIGSLEKGKKADLQIWDIPEFEHLIYRLDHNPVVSVIKTGRVLFDNGRRKS